jgi:hypothetical protein
MIWVNFEEIFRIIAESLNHPPERQYLTAIFNGYIIFTVLKVNYSKERSIWKWKRVYREYMGEFRDMHRTIFFRVSLVLFYLLDLFYLSLHR